MASITQLPGAGPAGRRLPPGIDPAPVWVPPPPALVEVLAGSAAGVGVALARPLAVAALRHAGGGRSRPGASPPPAPRLAAAVAADRRAGDPGWFGPGSAAWKIQADPSMFVAGVAAFALQLLHPLALAGVIDHGSFAEDFAGRVLRTGEFVQGVVFGGSSEAAARVAGVRGVHARVAGTSADGRRYSAGDPGLLGWVHLGEYLAIAAAYRRFGAYPLGDDELDRYVAEVAVVGEAMGVPEPPRSWSELDAAAQSYRPELAVTEQTLAALRFLRRPAGLPSAVQPAWSVLCAGAAGCLPPWARRLLRLRDPAPVELVATRSLVRGLAALLGDPPPLVAARARVGAGGEPGRAPAP